MPEPKTQTSWIALLVVAIIAFGILLAVRPSPSRASVNPAGMDETELTLSQPINQLNQPIDTVTSKAKTTKAVLVCPPTPTPTARTASASPGTRRAIP